MKTIHWFYQSSLAKSSFATWEFPVMESKKAVISYVWSERIYCDMISIARQRLDRLCDLLVRVSAYRSRGPGFDSWHYQFFWEIMGLEQRPLSLVSTTEELLGRNSRGSGLENREYGRGDPLRWPRDTLYPQKLALTSPTSCGRSVGTVRLRAKTTEFFLLGNG
jgi:hypothetical protein